MNEPMIEATTRLLTCLRDPLDSRALGSAAATEVVYRVLRGEESRVLFSKAKVRGPASRYGTSFRWVR